VLTEFGNDMTQLLLGVREMCQRLMMRNNDEKITPTMIKVIVLSGQASDCCSG